MTVKPSTRLSELRQIAPLPVAVATDRLVRSIEQSMRLEGYLTSTRANMMTPEAFQKWMETGVPQNGHPDHCTLCKMRWEDANADLLEAFIGMAEAIRDRYRFESTITRTHITIPWIK